MTGIEPSTSWTTVKYANHRSSVASALLSVEWVVSLCIIYKLTCFQPCTSTFKPYFVLNNGKFSISIIFFIRVVILWKLSLDRYRLHLQLCKLHHVQRILRLGSAYPGNLYNLKYWIFCYKLNSKFIDKIYIFLKSYT